MKSLTTETRQATKTTEKTIVDKHSLEYTEVLIVSAMRRGSFYARKFGTVLSFANHVFPNREPKPGLGQFGLVSIMKFPKCE